MTDTPFGNPNVTVADGAGETLRTVPDLDAEKSIVDTMLNLDDFLSGDVRRAESTARFCTRPDLEAKIEELNAELANLVDSQGRPRPVIDQPLDGSVGAGSRSALVVSAEIEDLQDQYAKAMATVRLRAMDEDDWTAFQTRHKKTLAEMPPYPPEFYEDLICSSEPTVTFPGNSAEKISTEQLRRLRKALGHAAFNAIASAAWSVNTESGVSVPKSLLSSAVLRQQTQG